MANKIISIILPKSRFSFGLKELMQYKDLIYIYAWREVKIKYKQAVLGVLWIVLQPLILMLIINLFMSKIFNTNTAISMPYYLFVYSGLILWGLFSNIVNNTVNNIVSNAGIIKKVYFPRLIIPISSGLAALFDFIISYIVLLVFLVITDVNLLFHFNILYLVFSLMIVVLFGLAMGIIFSSFVVKYRDFKYILPFFIQLLFFASPIIYSFESKISGIFKYLYYLNPLVLAFDLFRKSFINGDIALQDSLLIITVVIIVLIIGIFLFRKTEEYIADII